MQRCQRKEATYLSLGNSHFGSSGSSYSETPASMGASAVEERRVVILTRGVLEFMEELESADTCGCHARCNKGKNRKMEM